MVLFRCPNPKLMRSRAEACSRNRNSLCNRIHFLLCWSLPPFFVVATRKPNWRRALNQNEHGIFNEKSFPFAHNTARIIAALRSDEWAFFYIFKIILLSNNRPTIAQSGQNCCQTLTIYHHPRKVKSLFWQDKARETIQTKKKKQIIFNNNNNPPTTFQETKTFPVRS